jgi:1-pyrroline-5-carboxylate dehydrogenase
MTTDPVRLGFYEAIRAEPHDDALRLIFADWLDDHEDELWADTLHLVNETSDYALTGAVISKDRYAIDQAMRVLENAAGNFYINDKPTGAVVGQQPFGGARGSGTNDKAGSYLNLLRWVSPRTIKETFVTPAHYTYPWNA